MAGLSAGERASAALLARREELAQRITAALYAAEPGLLLRYGEAGRARCQEDMHHTLEHLAPALALGEPALFAGYVRWLVSLMASLGIPASDVHGTLQATRNLLAAELPSEEAALAVSMIEAARAALGEAS